MFIQYAHDKPIACFQVRVSHGGINGDDWASSSIRYIALIDGAWTESNITPSSQKDATYEDSKTVEYDSIWRQGVTFTGNLDRFHQANW
jgi:hypothetical protein